MRPTDGGHRKRGRHDHDPAGLLPFVSAAGTPAASATGRYGDSLLDGRARLLRVVAGASSSASASGSAIAGGARIGGGSGDGTPQEGEGGGRAFPSIKDGLGTGLYGGSVQLLPGIRPALMDRFEPRLMEVLERKRRQPREDLSGLTAEERLQRRKEKARTYSDRARTQQIELHKELEVEVAKMRVFRRVAEGGAVGMMVLRADLHAVMLYLNKSLEKQLGISHTVLLGGSLWEVLHPEDHAAVTASLSSVILLLTPPSRPVRCRLRSALGIAEFGYWPVDLNMASGTQGVVCTVWPAD